MHPSTAALVLTALLVAPVLEACSCMGSGDPCESVGGESIIFVGSVTEILPNLSFGEIVQSSLAAQRVVGAYLQKASDGTASEADWLAAVSALRKQYLETTGPVLGAEQRDQLLQASTLEEVKASVGDSSLEQVVRLTVDEPFQNWSSDTIEISTGYGMGDCGYPFEVGEKYLVQAWPGEDGARPSTGICTRTAPLERAQNDVEYFRKLVHAPPVGRVFGTVTEQRFNPARDYFERSAAGSFPIRITNPEESLDTITGPDGAYEFKGVSPGDYVLTSSSEELFLPESKPIEFHVEAKGCTALHLGVTPARGSLRGRILDHEGEPVAEIEVELQHESGSEQLVAKEITEEDGTFEIFGLEPGSYWVSVNAHQHPSMGMYGGGPFLTSYYPGASDTFGALLVEALAEGAEEFIEWRLGPRLKEQAVRGRVVEMDGTPVAQVHVSLIPDGAYSLDSYTHTNDGGTFELMRLVGVTYDVRAIAGEREVRQPLPDGADLVILKLPAAEQAR